MIIQNKQTGKQYSLTLREYQFLIDKKIAQKYTIISKDDDKKIVIPKEIIEFQQDPDKLRIKKTKQEPKEK
jgi:hypothetical protein